MTSSTLAFTIAVSLALGLGAAPEASADDPVRVIGINGYTVIDDRHVILTGGASRDYLVTLRRPCRELRFGYRVGTSFPATGTVHMPRSEFIITNDRRCRIETLEEVESVEVARQLIEERHDAAEAATGEEHSSNR